MPRTFKKWRGCRSVSYKANKHRGFARVSDRYSHHSVRNTNMFKDEIGFVKFNCKVKRTFGWPGISNKRVGNISNNIQGINDCEIDMWNDWRDKSFKDQLKGAIQNYENCYTYNISLKTLKDSLKQLERRGTMKPFVGHRQGNRFKKELQIIN